MAVDLCALTLVKCSVAVVKCLLTRVKIHSTLPEPLYSFSLFHKSLFYYPRNLLRSLLPPSPPAGGWGEGVGLFPGFLRLALRLTGKSWEFRKSKTHSITDYGLGLGTNVSSGRGLIAPSPVSSLISGLGVIS
jgi:hypothetical protein